MINLRARARTYYGLVKPGIVWGNALPAAAAFLFASQGRVDWILLVVMLLGLSCIIASAATLNNYLDRDIDATMERTHNRALVVGSIAPKRALFFGFVLLACGILVLGTTNMLALGTALFGFVVYVFWYTPLKRHSKHALWVGALAGATPPVVGYVAVTNTLDSTAVALFIFLCLWQLPHFLAIAVYRYDEYKAANIPLFIKKSPTQSQKQLARRVFFGSLVVLVLFCTVLVLIA
ncbi:MAG: heme o synthase [bacterium]|nr:heme o synthase [bacterium]